METTKNEFKASVNKTNIRNDFKTISPFYYINQLVKLAKRNEYMNNTNLAALNTQLRQIAAKEGGQIDVKRTGFNPAFLPKDSKGRFCFPKLRKLTFIFATTGDEVDYAHDNKGRDIIQTADGYRVLLPIQLDEKAFAVAFNEVASEYERNCKKSANERKKQIKQYDKEKAQIISDYDAGIISEVELSAQLCALKQRFAA